MNQEVIDLMNQLTTANAEIARLKESYTNMSDAHNKEFARAESERESKTAARGEVDRLRKQLGTQVGMIEKLRKAMEKIARGEGQFSVDHFQHCKNTVEDMKALAQQALTDTETKG